MPNSDYIVEMRGGGTLPVTDAQAQVVDQAFSKRAPVKIGDVTINTVDISGIWPTEQWYDSHPEQRPALNLQKTPTGLLSDPKKEYKVSELGELWLEAMRLNAKICRETGKYGMWRVVDGELSETATYPVAYGSPQATVMGKKITKNFSQHQFNKLREIPGYKVIDAEDNLLEFTVAA